MFSETDVDVARAILRHGPVPRSDVARMTGLTTGAVTKVTRRLIDKGLVAEGPPEYREQGRPVVPLSVVDESAKCLGVKIVPAGAYLASTGLTGQVVDAWRITLDTSSMESVAQSLTRVIGDGDYAAVGVVLPAAVGADGELHATRMLGWTQSGNLRARLSSATGVPCSVANDVHGLTQHAHWFGALRGYDNGVLVTLGQGIGVGAVVDDELQVGHQGAASILGRLWTTSGVVFGDILSIRALESRASQLMGRDASFPELLDDPDAQPAVESTVRALGQLVRAATIAYAPERVLLTGEGIEILRGRMPILEEELQVDWREDLDLPELVVEPLDISSFAVGAAGLAVCSLFVDR